MKQQEHPTTELKPVKQEPSGLRKVVKIAIILAVIFGLLFGATAIFAYLKVKGDLDDAADPGIRAIDKFPPGTARNILVLGSDRRDVVESGQRKERQFRGGSNSGRRADTILLIHIPPDQKSATVLSFPRDLRVKIPGESGMHKINGAYNFGANRMIETVKLHTGLPIHNYVEINFASFQKIVDAVGGVRLCVKRAYDDRQSGLIIKKPGCYNFNGSLALSYVRMRKSDPRGDFGRIDRQQQFMRVLMKKVTNIGFLFDLPRLFRLSSAVSKGLVTDTELSLGVMRGVAEKMAGFKQSNVDFRVVPSFADSIGGVSYVIEKTAEARALYKALLNDTTLPDYGKTGASLPKPGDITMRILNGTRTDGLAGFYRDKLRDLGFKVRGTSNAPRRDYAKTVIYYNSGLDAKAALVAEQFPGAEIREAESAQDVDIIVIVGADSAARASPAPSSS
jgi:LCP family protein required for cell wall assembly